LSQKTQAKNFSFLNFIAISLVDCSWKLEKKQPNYRFSAKGSCFFLSANMVLVFNHSLYIRQSLTLKYLEPAPKDKSTCALILPIVSQ
jgi:hypothetical protein